MAKPAQIKTRVESVFEDPTAQAVARVYAQAILDAAPADQAGEVLAELFAFVDEVFASSTGIAEVLTSAIVSRENKMALIERALAGRASDHLVTALQVVARHDRLELLPLILHECRLLYEESSGHRRVEITSARPLSEATLKLIRQRLEEKLSIKPILETFVVPEILGGLRIRVGDTVYDSSLRSRLDQLRSRLRERSFHEIQSRRNRFSHPDGN